MHVLPLALQLLAAAHAPVAPRDSAALIAEVKEAEFWFVMRWRDLVLQDESRRVGPTLRAMPVTAADIRGGASYGEILPLRGVIKEVLPADKSLSSPYSPKPPSGALGCSVEFRNLYDVDQHSWLAHLINAPDLHYSICTRWKPGPPPADDPALLDRELTRDGLDSVRAARAMFLARLDSAARVMPADGWITGQRVRFELQQDNAQAAARIAAECHAADWWCSALTGYVRYATGDHTGAEQPLLKAQGQMPLTVRCAWDDVGPLLVFSERQRYDALSCAARDSINIVAWWLADPLFVENGNDRLAEQLARRTMIALRDGADIDIWTDWRDAYQGPALRETTLRYGWANWAAVDAFYWPGDTQRLRALFEPHSAYYEDPRDSLRPLPQVHQHIPFGAGDTRDTFLGLGGGVTYPGPQFHTMPSLRAMLDPMTVDSTDWDIAPGRDRADRLGRWDGSWWAPEFYLRRAGPLVPVESQIGMMRRANGVLLASAMAWDTAGYMFTPPAQFVAAALTMTGPSSVRKGGTDTMSIRTMHGFAVPIPSGPAVLSLEMVPRDGQGTAGRTRFGVTAPAPLAALTAGTFALSDLVLLRATPGHDAPSTMQGMLALMLGSTHLIRPAHVGVYWEVYGLGDRDTVNVSIRILRHDDSNMLQRVGARIGIGTVKGDSATVTWREPRSGDPVATTEGGVSIRPRGVVLDLSLLSAGAYALEVAVERAGVTTRSVREITIAR